MREAAPQNSDLEICLFWGWTYRVRGQEGRVTAVAGPAFLTMAVPGWQPGFWGSPLLTLHRLSFLVTGCEVTSVTEW